MPKPVSVRNGGKPRYILKKDVEPKLQGKWCVSCAARRRPLRVCAGGGLCAVARRAAPLPPPRCRFHARRAPPPPAPAAPPAPLSPCRYPGDDIAQPLKRKFTPGVAKLRPSLVPGAVLVLLAGRFKGRRVVFLKQLPSGLLLVTGASSFRCPAKALLAAAGRPPPPPPTLASRRPPPSRHLRAGPFAVNGVPLRRVNAAFVIATSTVLDVSKAVLPALADKKSEAAFFTEDKKPLAKGKAGWEEAQKSKEDKGSKELPAAKKAAQAAVDGAIKLTAELGKYLKAKFSLSKGDKPHEMKF